MNFAKLLYQYRRKLNSLIGDKKSLLIISFILLPTSAAYAQEPTPESVTLNLLFRLVIIVFALIIAWITRGLLLRRLNSMMHKESKVPQPDSKAESKVKKVINPNDLVLTELDFDSKTGESTSIREKLVRQAKKGLRKLLYTDLIAIAAYGILGILFYVDEIDLAQNTEWGDQLMDHAQMYFLYLFLLFVWNIGRFVGYRHQFRAYSDGAFGFFKPLWKLVFWPFQSRWCLVLSAAIMIIALNSFLKFGQSPLLLIALIIHLILIYRLRVSGRKTPNLKLLILRVFHNKKASTFTFAGLVNFWKHFGSYFTVADPTFYRENWKKRFNYNFPIYIIVIFLILTQLSDRTKLEDLAGLFFLFTSLLILASIAFIVSTRYNMKRKFIRDEESLRKRLAKLNRWPKGYENTFKELPIMCYKNTWQQAVEVLSETADVVLMDLRGYSESNKGCEFEVNLLFDHIPLSRILFLADKKSLSVIKEMISRLWKEQIETSPNLHVKNPEALIFVSAQQNNKEIQGILDTLLEITQVNEPDSKTLASA